MTAERHERVMIAARRGRITFFERPTHKEIEFDVDTGEPIEVAYEHGVCAGCVTDAADGREKERCARDDAWTHCATVDEVAAYVGPVSE